MTEEGRQRFTKRNRKLFCFKPEYQYGQEERERKQKEIDAITQEVLDGAPKDGQSMKKFNMYMNM